jgi:hypothetical protein
VIAINLLRVSEAIKLTTVVPSFVPFNELLPLYELVNTLRGKGMFSIGSIKRALKKAMATIF